ncbi:hypothetical protein E4H12_00955 [Candidatus Thorarchaeota archaeon]|nr:hypothetical protein [Candidatus Thorarchaeota archaeon]TFG99938.1 MAG: hypothetical protein E4H12_00955 [Candidatus Thorarchaeota archaeon]
MRNEVPFLLCIIGGILMIMASVVGSADLWIQIFAFAETIVPGSGEILGLVLIVLRYIAGLGGVAVIIGGYLVTTDRVGTGKFVIGLAAGLGLIGLIINLVTAYMAVGIAAFTDFLNLLATSSGVLGPVLTIIARTKVKKPE